MNLNSGPVTESPPRNDSHNLSLFTAMKSCLPLLALLLVVPATAGDFESAYLLNSTSATKAVHGPFPAETLAGIPESRLARLSEDTVFLLTAACPPMSMTRLRDAAPLPAAPRSNPLDLLPEGLGIHSPGDPGPWTVSEVGGATVAQSDTGIRVLAFGDGTLYTEEIESISLPDGGGFEILQSRRQSYNIMRAPDGEPLQGGQDWIWLRNPKDGSGVAVVPSGSTTLRATAGGWNAENGNRAFWILPAGDLSAAWQAVFSRHPSVLLHPLENGTGWRGTVGSRPQTAHLTVTDLNRNGSPDSAGDLWSVENGNGNRLLYRFTPPGEETYARVAIFKTETSPEGTPPPLDLTGGARGDRFAKALDSIGAATPGAVPASGEDILKPEIIVEDWNRDGAFFEGSLLAGGFLGADRAGRRVGDWSAAWDLDGDRLGDVFAYNPSMLFNFKNTFISVLEVEIDPFAAHAALHLRKGYDMQQYASHFSKSPSSSQFVEEAPAGFEEHFFVDLPADPESSFFPKGANFFYYTIGGGDVNRLTMGRLSGHGGLRAWEIELDPVPADPEAVDFQVVRWKDAAGHELAMNTISVPETWDGKTLGPDGYLAGWNAMATGTYKTKALYATFSPPGSQMGSSEGMYGGAYTTQERIEADLDGGTYEIYYSPLMGDLHLKGADYGTYAVPSGTEDFWLDINRFYHREAHLGPERFVGVEPAIRFREREAKRMEGPVFLSYTDQSGDGFFDSYLYDMDNDGLYDRILNHDKNAGLLQLRDDRFLTAWPEKVDFDVVRYLPENYTRLSELYQRGFPHPPLVACTSIGSGGIPVSLRTHPYFREVTPPAFVSLPDSWQVRVAVEAGLNPAGRFGWTDFRPDGLSRLGTLFVEQGLTQTQVDTPWSAGGLEGKDVLVLSHLSVTPSPEDLEALFDWVRQGGHLLVGPGASTIQRLRFNAIGRTFDFRLEAERTERLTVKSHWVSLGPINRPDSRAALRKTPGPWNRIEHFSAPAAPGLLGDFTALSFDGFSLENLSDDWNLLLTYNQEGSTKPLIAERAIGRGQVILLGVDWLSNRSIWHHESFERGTQNERLVQRLVRRLTHGLPIPRVHSIWQDDATMRFEVSGKGGPVRFPRRYQARATGLAHIGNDTELPAPRMLSHAEIDGSPLEVREQGVLREITLPEGTHSITIHYPVAP